MKRMLIFFSSILLTIALSAQVRQVNFNDVNRLAENNARAIWGNNITNMGAIPYYGPDDTIIAWRYNFAMGSSLPNRAELEQRCAEAMAAGNWTEAQGANEYANMVVGANRQMPVFVQYSKNLSQEIYLAKKLEQLALQEFPQGYELEKIYFYGVNSIWYCIKGGSERKYIKLLSVPKVMESAEFSKMTAEREYSWTDNEVEDEWVSLLDDNELIDVERSTSIISGEDKMPYIQWAFGCVPCSASMIFCWWDNFHGLGKLVDYYYFYYDDIQDHYDFHVPSVLPRLAHYMDTSDEGNTYPGWVNDGVEDAASQQGYTFDCEGSWGLWPDSYFFNEIRDYIRDSDTPGLATIDPGYLDYHTVACVGYQTNPNRIIVHDPNDAVQVSYSYSILEGDWYVYPELYPSHYLTLLSPHGGTNWHNNDGGEEYLLSGDWWEIRWHSNTDVDSTYVKLFYNVEGGESSADWIQITDNTSDDGYYDWLVPSISSTWGDMSNYVRIKIELYESGTNTLLAQDGSYGSFRINPGGSLSPLTNTMTSLESNPDYFSVDCNMTNTWSILSLRSDFWNHDYWKIELFDDTNFTDVAPVDESFLWDLTNYILIDNHHVSPNQYGVKLSTSYEIAVHPKAQFKQATTNLLVGSPNNITWDHSDIAQVYNVYLEEGRYFFNMSMTEGTSDLDIALFKWGSNGILAINEAEAISDNDEPGGHESFYYNSTTPGYYALVLSSRYFLIEPSTQCSITIEEPGRWLGTASSYWFNTLNWSGQMIPDENEDVVIPTGCTHYPTLNSGVSNAAYAGSVMIEAGANITILDGYLNIYGNLAVAGILRLLHDNAEVTVEGNVDWMNYGSVGMTGTSILNCYGNWTFERYAEFQPSAGYVCLVSDNQSMITCKSPNSWFYNLKLMKTDGAIASLDVFSLADLDIRGDLINEAGSIFQSTSSRDILIHNLFLNNGSFHFDNGTVKFLGTHAYLDCIAGNYFNNVEINVVNIVALLTDVYIHGDLIINSGGILATSYHIYIGGSWYNNLGTEGFNEGTSTVTFNGSGIKFCTGEDFYNLEINNPECNLRFTTGSSSIAHYNWTAGALNIVSGTLTINNLVDNGLWGKYYVYGGTLNVYQGTTINQLVDLCGEVYIFDGTMNVYGGYSTSFWPGVNHAFLAMTGGVLDFRTVGIYINASANLLTAHLTGGTIRTVGSISCNRTDFNPAAGAFEMYGESDKSINVAAGCSLPSLVINKLVTTRQEQDERSREDEQTRSRTVTLSSDLHLTGALVIQTGSLNLNGHTLSTEFETEVYGTLIMTNVLDVLDIGTSLTWYGSATDNITTGEIRIGQDLITETGSNFDLGAGNTVKFVGEENSILYLGTNPMNFNNLILEKTTGEVSMFAGTQYLNIINNFSVLVGNAFYPQSASVSVGGLFVIDGLVLVESGCVMNIHDLTISGNFVFSGGTVTVSNAFQELASASLIVTEGSLILDKPYTGSYFRFAGFTNLTSGIIRITNEGFQTVTTSDFNINSGILSVGWNFRALNANTFHQTGGSVEFTGARVAAIETATGNYFHDLVFNKSGNSYTITLMNDVTVNNDLIVSGGDAGLGSHTLNVGRDVIINGGILTANNAADIINVGRSWSNSSGAANFVQGSGTVNFVSDQAGTISTEDFNIVYIDKSSPVQNDMVINTHSTMTTAGWLYIALGCLKLGENSILDANNNITIMDGGGLALQSGGVINTLRLAGHLYDQNVEFGNGIGFDAVTESNFILDGNADQNLNGTNYPTMQFYNVTVNKSGGKVKPYNHTYFSGNLTISNGEWSYGVSGKNKFFLKDFIVEATGTFSDSTGTTTFEGNSDVNMKVLGIAKFGSLTVSKTNTSNINLTGNTTLTGSNIINLTSGILNVNAYTFKYKGSLLIGADGRLNLTGGSVLKIDNTSTLTVATGGEFSSIGTLSNAATVTADLGYYTFSATAINSFVGAQYTIFERMGTNGINLGNRCGVDSTNVFRGCTFRNGIAGGTLLTINPQLFLNVYDAHFPTNTWGGLYNVSRNYTLGSVTFHNYSGDFAGPNFDYSPNNTIFWATMAPPETPQNVQINILSNVVWLMWDPIPEVTGFRIYKSYTPGNPASFIQVGVSATTWWWDPVTPLEPEAFYLVKSYVD